MCRKQDTHKPDTNLRISSDVGISPISAPTRSGVVSRYRVWSEQMLQPQLVHCLSVVNRQQHPKEYCRSGRCEYIVYRSQSIELYQKLPVTKVFHVLVL